MIRSNKHLVTLSLAVAMICSPTFTRADNASKRRPTSRSKISRASGATRSATTRQPVTKRPAALPSRPSRFVLPSRPTTVRPPATRRPTTARPAREAGTTIAPIRRPAVTRPQVTRPPTGKEISPLRRVPTGERPHNNPGLDDFLREATKHSPVTKDGSRIPRPIGEKIIEVDRFDKIVRPLKNDDKNKQRDPTRDDESDKGAGDPGKGKGKRNSGNGVDEAEEAGEAAEDAEGAGADSALIILPGFTFVFGGGTHTIHETHLVETIVAVEGETVVAADDNRIREVEALPEVRAGSTYSLSATGLGKEPGHVVIQVNELYLNTTVDKWSNDEATVTLPLVGMAQPQRAALLMLDAEGQVVESIDVMFLPAKEDSK